MEKLLAMLIVAEAGHVDTVLASNLAAIDVMALSAHIQALPSMEQIFIKERLERLVEMLGDHQFDLVQELASLQQEMQHSRKAESGNRAYLKLAAINHRH